MIATARRSWRFLARHGLDLIYPPACLVCARPTGEGSPEFCNACHATLTVEMSAPACPHCAHSIGPHGFQGGRCAFCRDSFGQVDGMVRGGRYAGTTAALLRAFKYHGRDEIDRVLGGVLAEAMRLADWFEAVDALVVVPTHWRRLLGIPYYTPELLGKTVARRTGVPLAPVLRRVAAGPHQFDVPRSQRVQNIRGKFALASGARVRGADICLVDDVSTTGATVNECARVLRDAGADSVFVAVATRVDTDTVAYDA